VTLHPTMPRRVTNQELLQTVYAAANEAVDQLELLPADGALPLDRVTALRNKLREAYCAVQELKTRIKTGVVHPGKKGKENQ